MTLPFWVMTRFTEMKLFPLLDGVIYTFYDLTLEKKQLIIDFRRKKSVSPVVIKDQPIELVETYVSALEYIWTRN